MPAIPRVPAAGFRSIYRPPFRLDLEVRPGVRRILPAAALAAALRAALLAGGAPEPAAVGLILADDAELAALNAAHMGTSGPTDVLSFPLLPAGGVPAAPGRSAAPARRRPLAVVRAR